MKRLVTGLICLCFFVLSNAQDRIAIQHGPYIQNLKDS